MRKIKIGFEVSEADYLKYKEIKTTVLKEHNKLRGVLGHEIIRLAYTSQAYSEKKEKVLQPKIYKHTKEKLRRLFDMIPDRAEFNEKVLDKWIEKCIGISGPTKRNYKNMLIGHGVILNHKESVSGVIVYKKGELPAWLK